MAKKTTQPGKPSSEIKAQPESPIGRAKGPGEATYEYALITPDKDKVKIGEYLYYEAKDGKGIIRKILSRVSSLQPVRLYPDEMLADPALDPSFVAQTINYSNQKIEIYEVGAQIMGYFDPSSNGFINPRTPPQPGAPIYIVPKDDLIEWLSPKKTGELGAAQVGVLLNRVEEEIPVVLNVIEIVNTHLAVLAATGSGKSYTVGVLLEEFMMPNNKGAVLIFDPHGEYETFEEIKYAAQFKGPDGYVPKVEVVKPEDIKLRLSELSLAELSTLLEGLSDKMKNILNDALDALQSDNTTKDNYTVQQLIDAVLACEDKNNSSSIQGLLWRLNFNIKNNPLVDDRRTMYLQDLLEPGKITILRISEMEQPLQQLIVSVLLNRILKSRIAHKKGFEVKEERNELSYPVFTVLEEGHRFAPAHEESRSKKVLKTILSEGRKFGVGVCIVSQRPGKLDPDVLSQCMTQVVMKMKNESDQQNIKSSLESFSADMIAELPGLTRGQAIIAGTAINTPVLVQVRERYIRHGGTSTNAVEAWQSYKKVASPSKVKFDNQDEPVI